MDSNHRLQIWVQISNTPRFGSVYIQSFVLDPSFHKNTAESQTLYLLHAFQTAVTNSCAKVADMKISPTCPEQYGWSPEGRSSLWKG